ncbi:LOW QUALITY PROTEIN: proto-oncogene vav [Emys orbicularis]|uniref:LOW QUALITY PROTEIN: proto-oncogene vav n=1 Tax=Emys orbicularis TaxID=82168 RepID=UPI0031FE374E
MELWKQCANWLIQCRVLPPNHRVTWPGAQVCELAQALRDGVLLCQLLNNLMPHAVNLREINLRPQMSQFLCLKNIRTFLSTCCDKFGLRKNELFEVFDLFDVRDFGKVIETLSILSWTQVAQSKGIMPFPTEDSVADNDIYGDLSDQIDDTVEEDDDLYDCVENEEAEGDEIYEDLMRSEPAVMPQKMTELDKRNCCLQEIRQTEEKYTDTLESIYQECSQRANNGRFTLRDLLMVPMQRVLKYHLLLQELVKHTVEPTEKENLRLALDAMRDLAQCVNEIKRDNETLKQITNFQLSIEKLSQSLAQYGRPKIDGELKVTSSEKRSKTDRYAFLLDQALLICKRKGDSYEMRDFIDLHTYQIRDDPLGEKDNKKWTHMFHLICSYGTQGYELFFKTRELKKKWMEQFEMSISNIYPENATSNGHDFHMHSFEENASCKSCQMLLRGTFYQGYRCSRCKAPAHKECLGRVSPCGKSSSDYGSTLKKNKSNRHTQERKKNELGLPKMEVCQEYYGLPPPPVAFGPSLRLSMGDIVELTKAEVEQLWWEGRNTSTNEIGWFPCQKVKPYVCNPPPDFSVYLWYAGPMERAEAEQILTNRSDGTFLVRQRVKDAAEFAISIKFNVEIKHIKILTSEGLYRITEKKAFKGLIELVEFYQHNSLKDCFKTLDTTLQFPFKEPERRAISRPPAGGLKYFGSAKARYDFCARDRTELTLKEGDIIKILSKKGAAGWWKGEIYGGSLGPAPPRPDTSPADPYARRPLARTPPPQIPTPGAPSPGHLPRRSLRPAPPRPDASPADPYARRPLARTPPPQIPTPGAPSPGRLPRRSLRPAPPRPDASPADPYARRPLARTPPPQIPTPGAPSPGRLPRRSLRPAPPRPDASPADPYARRPLARTPPPQIPTPGAPSPGRLPRRSLCPAPPRPDASPADPYARRPRTRYAQQPLPRDPSP